MNQIWLAFITGLTSGGISCLAVQGGFLASSVAQTENTSKNHKLKQIALFLGSKIFAYTLFGVLLGIGGSILVISFRAQAWIQILAGLFMIATAANLLNLHPIFRYTVIRPPKFAYKLLKRKSTDASLVAPAFLGFLTVLIPCGVTQAMIILALTSGSPFKAAGILFAFTLGTVPVFFTIGYGAAELLKRKAFVYASALIIFILGVISINSGQILRGSPHTLQNYASAVKSLFATSSKVKGIAPKVNAEGKQEITINLNNNAHTTNDSTLKAGIPVKITFVSNNVQSCARSFLIPSMGISKILPQNGVTTIEFTPTAKGILRYTCGMGMYTGQFDVES